MRPTFLPLDAFTPVADAYELMPFRFVRVPQVPGRVLLVSDWGEWRFLEDDEFDEFVAGTLSRQSDDFLDLSSKHFCSDVDFQLTKRIAATKYAAKKAHLAQDAALHIFVVTLRCNHSCHYCQVSRQMTGVGGHDMTADTAMAAIDRLFEHRNPAITVEFQGGEPLVAFEMVRLITEEIERRNEVAGKDIRFTMTSTLHHVTGEVLAFLAKHRFHISTSIDGPADLHDVNRPVPGGGAHRGTLKGLRQAQEVLGKQGVAALTTLTRRSLERPEEIIDEYVSLGFKAIFLRPLSPYGFATRAQEKIGYSTADFLKFYGRALSYILELNRQGVEIQEVYAGLLLKHILTPWQSGYVDLRSPAGAGFGVLVYNYDGGVYASDEARMLAEAGDHTFRLGSVHEKLSELHRSDAMAILISTGVAEALPGCADCAYLPFCGADPVYHYATQGDPVGHRPSSGFCQRHMGMFELLFRHLHEANPHVLKTFHRWASGGTKPVSLQREVA